MTRTRRDPADLLIGSGLDLTKPFTTRHARDHGLSRDHLGALCREGLLAHPMRGCFHVAHLPDSLDLRVSCLRILVPSACVVTDRTAGWLHGASMILAPGDHLVVPKVSVFHLPGNRLRNDLSRSGERTLAERDITEIQGVRVTTPIRTACDLGRLLSRDSSFAALDSMLGLGQFTHDDLNREVERFRGYRGVRRLRTFAPLADGRSESFGESVLRLRWYDGGAPCLPETQIEVFSEGGRFVARVDLGVERWRYAAEYDGAEFHGPEQAEQDRRRREQLYELGWIVDVFRQEHLFGRAQTADVMLRHAVSAAKLRASAG